MSHRLFGTDGVRGRAGEFLSAELALTLARAAVEESLASDSGGSGLRATTDRSHAPAGRPKVLIVRDTRESGEMLEAAIAAGVTAAGGDVLRAGVLPTPAAPLLLRRHGLQMAAVISASHNPYEDNGIKLFAADGFKLSDEHEERIEQLMHGAASVSPLAERSTPERIGSVHRLNGALEDYLRELHSRFQGLDLSGKRIVLDCANGATYRSAPEIFRRLGAHVEVLADQPDGRNINAGCGSTHIDALQQIMAAGNHDAGFAFDGDGDRVLAVDHNGQLVDGDELIAIAAKHFKSTGQLADGGGVAVTVMTNYGFHTAMQDAGIEVAITAVGDRYVNAELRRREWRLGGEQSGHIIDLGFGPSGDGIASALLTLEALGDGDLADSRTMRKLPQKLVNIRAASRSELSTAMESEPVRAAISDADQGLSGRGRVLVRASGTEPLIRVMVEAPTVAETDRVCQQLAAAVESALS
jgi:phosphoglucosamine mutase